ncbi:hypothetical protein ACHAW5_003916 [Stephanodiscus triporus]|uniref:Uncharacterized protein n=1 Tax=Stephanodiscus triporus TaxID=2934178 RepID=A0ABD3MIM6_9STRA
MLTPCFDANGKHDAPEEGCQCRVDKPHLHVHDYDPKRFSIADGAARAKATNWKFLSQLTQYQMMTKGRSP